MSAIDELVEANQAFSRRREPHLLPLPPARRVAVVTCMDARILPAQALGLEEGDAHVIRNAGGRAREALRSLVISQRLLGTKEIVVIHHTDCGMLTFTNEGIRTKIRQELNAEAGDIDFLPFADLEQSVRDDLTLLKASPLLSTTSIRGFVYDVEKGVLTEVRA